MENLKRKIVVLWLSFAVTMTAHYAMLLFDPGLFNLILGGSIPLPPTFAVAETFINWLIPLALALLTVTLSDPWNRRMNLFAGVLFTIYGFGHIVACPIVHIFTGPAVHQLIISVGTIIVTLLISYYAYTWQ